MRPRVLIVDDSLTVRMDLGEAFEAAGFDATLAATEAAARDALRKGAFALVLLDVLLPDGDGIAILRDLRSDAAMASLPIMMLSTEAEVRDRIRGLQTGANEYVGKPYDSTYVIARARELLRKAEPSRAAGAQLAVLIVDDSLTFREALRQALEAASYTVLVAATGEEGLRLASDSRPDAMIVDGMLPGIDGAGVIRRARMDAVLRRMPCLLLTASTDRQDELRALDAGADAYVRKEEDLTVILARLAAILRVGGAPSAISATSSLLGPKKVLAVDDSPTYLQELATALREDGFEVVLARSGEECLELLSVQTVDCILLDLLMPGLGGQETCRQIKSSPSSRDIPLVMLTALEEREAMIAGINAGADDYITKSSDFDVLKARLRAQLRRRQFEDENRSIREQLLQKELEAAEARSARDLAEARSAFLADLEQKNVELALANTELARARDQAERVSRFKSKFLAGMSHELRTPLNAIIGFSELLEQQIFGPLLPTQLEYVQNVLESGRHLLCLINDVLDISKVEAGKMDLRREWTQLGAIVDAACSHVQALAGKQGVSLVVSVPEALPEVYVDPVRIKQVLYNLLSNAVKFTPKGGTIRLLVAAENRQLQIRVEDTGIGIRPEDMSRLFQEFEQIEPVTGKKPDGTGLGLILTKRLVELHGGSISAESDVGKGSVFVVHLPLPRISEPPASAVRDGEAAREAVVLVVEDDPKAAELIAAHLRAVGLSPVFAAGGEEAIEVAAELRPSAITLDIAMPGIDGWAVLAHLKGSPVTSSIPIVVVSVVDAPNRGLVLGAADYLVKPVSRDALLDSLEAIGVPLHRVSGLLVLIVNSSNEPINGLEGHLRNAGCEIRHAAQLSPAVLTEPDPADIVLVDLRYRPSGTDADIEGFIEAARALSVPIVGLLEPGQDEERSWRAHHDALIRREHGEADRLVRAVRAAVDQHRPRPALRHAPTGLPSRQALLERLRGALQRADREASRLAIIAARVPLPGAPGPAPWPSLLPPRFRDGDFVAVAGENAVALVACGIGEAAVEALARRFVELLQTAAKTESVPSTRTVWYSLDGSSAEDLLERALGALAEGAP